MCKALRLLFQSTLALRVTKKKKEEAVRGRENERIGRVVQGENARPFVGASKSQLIEDLSTFGDKYPRNGSKNEPMAPTTDLGCPHEGPRVVRWDRSVLKAGQPERFYQC